MITLIYSILHMFVDGICAFAMFGKFVTGSSGYEIFLIYNFCAFALQMPFGAMLDLFNIKRKMITNICAMFGVVLATLGAWIHPVILGVGNALFHVGAGVGVIHEDEKKCLNGQAFGIFVAPGAWGLYLGTQLTKNGISGVQILLTCILVATLILLTRQKIYIAVEETITSARISLLVSCFAVVVLRSYVGMTVSFPWKTTVIAGCLSVFAVVLGKITGGILAARIGTKITIIASLIMASICYFFSSNMIMGILALFLFNMTMPITLYLLVKCWKELPGFIFGLLTFGLFLGFLPVYYGVQVPVTGQIIGTMGSLLSLLLLFVGNGWWKK